MCGIASLALGTPEVCIVFAAAPMGREAVDAIEERVFALLRCQGPREAGRPDALPLRALRSPVHLRRRRCAERRDALRALATALAIALLVGCGSSPEPPHVLLVTVDTLRPDYMSLHGYDRETTPRLDAILSEGFVFEQAVSPIGRTTPALASLLTGAYPHRTGVRTLTDALPRDVPTLATLLSADGYRSFAVVTNQVLTRDRGLDRGFTVYDDAFDDRTARATTDDALALLDTLPADARVFGWVHYIDPHVPYHPPPEIARELDPGYEGPYALHFGWQRQPGEPRERHRTFPEALPKRIATHRNPLPEEVNAHIRRLYAGDVRATDAEVGRLVDGVRARLGENVLLVFTGDHGESLGEHDFHWDHGDYVYGAGTRVPLAFVLPPRHPLAGHGRCVGWVSLVDVLPTVLALLGRPIPAGVEGRPLLACMREEALASAPVFAESGRAYYFDLVDRRQRNDVPGRLRAVVHDDWKLVWTPFLPDAEAWQLFDLARDPDETQDLYRPDHPRVAPLRAALEAWLSRTGRPGETREPSEADREALRALGYVE